MFGISVWWPNYVINCVDRTNMHLILKLSFLALHPGKLIELLRYGAYASDQPLAKEPEDSGYEIDH